MDIFGGSDSDDDDDGYSFDFSNLVFIDIMSCKSPNKFELEILLISVDITTANILLKLKERLSNAKFENVSTIYQDSTLYDLIVYLDVISAIKYQNKSPPHIETLENQLLPGGTLIMQVDDVATIAKKFFSPNRWTLVEDITDRRKIDNCPVFVKAVRRSISANTAVAKYWESAEPISELELLDSITICLSNPERRSGALASVSHAKAVAALKDEGVCILRGLLAPHVVKSWGIAFESDFKKALAKLNERGMNLVQPAEGTFIPNFYELSMREAARCDLRNTPTVVLHRAALAGDEIASLKRHPAVLAILNDVMNPDGPEELAVGNWGRWNFNGQGPTAKPLLAASDVGAIMTVPGCADQSIHADTPHLFVSSHHLPPHYVNLFMPALSRPGQSHPSVGQTAFALGSHRLEVSAEVMAQAGGEESLRQRLIRPQLETGDALLFDCRILHFGLANTSEEPEAVRPMLYVNFHQTWFSDPKNWNHEERLFQPS